MLPILADEPGPDGFTKTRDSNIQIAEYVTLALGAGIAPTELNILPYLTDFPQLYPRIVGGR